MGLSSLRAAALLLTATILLTSCGSDSDDTGDSGTTPEPTQPAAQLFPDDFEVVCSGATQSKAPDYATTEAHKALYFETYEDSLLDQSSRLPSDWTVQYDAATDAYAAVDVVACGVRTAEELAQKCEGYEDDETGLVGSVNWHTGTYELTAYEARTGVELGRTTLEATDRECPMIASFDEGEDEIDMFDSPKEEDVIKFLKPFVQP